MASIAALPSISKTVHAGPVPGAQDDDFDSVLASVAHAHESAPLESHRLDPAPIAAPKIASAPIAKLPQHVQRSRPSAKQSPPGVVAQDNPAPTPQTHPSKVETSPQSEAAPVSVIASVPAAASLASTADIASDDGEPVQADAALPSDARLAGTSLNNAPLSSLPPIDVSPSKAALSNAPTNTPPNSALTDNRSLPQNGQVKSAAFGIVPDAISGPREQSAPVKGVALPADVVDKIVAAAGGQPKQQVALPQTAQAQAATSSASPQNIASLMNTARASIVVMPSPEPRVAAKPDVKPDAKAPAAQSAGAGKADATQVAAHERPVQPLQQDSADDDAQADKPAAHAPQDQAAKPDQSAAPSEKVAQTPSAPATSTQVQQQVAQSPSQIVAGSSPPVAPVRAEPAQTPASEPQPNVGAIAAAIAAKSIAGSKTFEIRLDPPELGRVDVHMTVDNDGRVQALVMADHPHTLDLLQRGSHDLERALKDAGLNLSNNSLNFSLKGEGRQGDGGGASMARTRSLTSAVVARAEAANASEINLSSANGRLDIRV